MRVLLTEASLGEADPPPIRKLGLVCGLQARAAGAGDQRRTRSRPAV
jgi:hypothetical protein